MPSNVPEYTGTRDQPSEKFFREEHRKLPSYCAMTDTFREYGNHSALIEVKSNKDYPRTGSIWRQRDDADLLGIPFFVVVTNGKYPMKYFSMNEHARRIIGESRTINDLDEWIYFMKELNSRQ